VAGGADVAGRATGLDMWKVKARGEMGLRGGMESQLVRTMGPVDRSTSPWREAQEASSLRGSSEPSVASSQLLPRNGANGVNALHSSASLKIRGVLSLTATGQVKVESPLKGRMRRKTKRGESDGWG